MMNRKLFKRSGRGLSMYFHVICVGWGMSKAPAAAIFIIYIYIYTHSLNCIIIEEVKCTSTVLFHVRPTNQAFFA
jgi:hypothetical protein